MLVVGWLVSWWLVSSVGWWVGFFVLPSLPLPPPLFHDNESDWFVLYCRGKGVVVNVSSATGMAPMALSSLYSGTKVWICFVG